MSTMYGSGTINDTNKSENGDETVTTIEELPVYLLGTTVLFTVIIIRSG